MSDDESESDHWDENFEPRPIAWQYRSKVTLIQPNLVLKEGPSVRPAEEDAMRLVKKYLPHIPVPSLHGLAFRYADGIPIRGKLEMDFMPGRTLREAWTGLDDATKDRICKDIWDLVAELHKVPPPEDLEPVSYRTVDGSPSYDLLLGTGWSGDDVTPHSADIPEKLPRPNVSVFCHGDIHPGNLLVNEDCRISAVLDWESSGWYPDYWEYVQMMKYGPEEDYEWQRWMEKTRPEPWDISAIQKARRVLF